MTLTPDKVARGAVARLGLRALTGNRADGGGGGADYWMPFVGTPQERAYHCDADVIGFGGAGGGGKTDLILGKAFTRFYESIIFRREYQQLKGVIRRGDDIQDGRCRYVAGDKKQWSTPDGRTIELGAMQYDHDKNAYKGRPHDFIAFDEAADFLETQVRFVLGWLRTARTDIKPQAILTFNPPTTAEGEWIIKFFGPWLDEQNPNPAQPGEIRYFVHAQDRDIEVPDVNAVTIDGKTYTPQSRTFFRAYVDDNPVYMATGYDKQLESLPEPLRSQLRWGDFAVGADDDRWQVIPTAWVIAAQNRWLNTPKPDVKLRAAGVDVARGGRDKTVVAKLYGNWFAELVSYPGSDTGDGAIGATLVANALEDDAPTAVDVIGYGASVYDHLKVLPGLGAYVSAVNNASAATSTDKTGRYQFVNLRAETYWKFREALDPESGENICLPPDRQLRADLCAARYRVVGGKYQVEPKPDIIKRIGRSPDAADAVVLAWYAPNAPRHRFATW